jgi:hypothetical protein
MQTTGIAPVGTIEAVSRKETLFDTNAIVTTFSVAAGGVFGQMLPANLKLFNNFDQFTGPAVNVANTNLIAKQDGLMTNLSGSSSALPQGYEHEWFEWRAAVKTFDANLNTVSTTGVPEQLERIREMGFIQYQSTQNPYITAQLRDVTSFVESRTIFTTFPNVTVMAPNISTRGGKSISIEGEPYIIQPQEQFKLLAGWPGAQVGTPQAAGNAPNGPVGTFIAQVPYYLTVYLDGIESRATT